MNVAFFGKMAFEDVIKDLRRDHQVIWEGPKSNDNCPYKGQKEDSDTERRGEGQKDMCSWRHRLE